MSIDVSPIFVPIKLGPKEMANRIVMPPMVVLYGITTPKGIEWYGEHASRGAGLVIVEATRVTRFGDELTGENLKPLVDAIHAGGALAAIQISANTHGGGDEPTRVENIEHVLASFRRAAAVCRDAGFDGIEPHGAHNFVLNRFFSPVLNERRDEFGGDTLANRMRMGLRVCRAIREVCGSEELLLLYRHTPVGEGYGIEDSLVFAKELVYAGVDVLDISPASVKAPGDNAAPFRKFGVPVIAVNELDKVERALEVLDEERADLVAVGRGLIADPAWPEKIREGRFEDIVRCVLCDEGCFGNVHQDKGVACTQWGINSW